MRGTQISDTLLDHQGRKCQLSPKKSILSTYQVICPLSHFILSSKECQSVCFFFNQYNSLIRKTQTSNQPSVKDKPREGGKPNFQHLGEGSGRNGKFQF